MNVPSVACAVLVLLSAAAFNAQANDVGFYVGGALGQAKKDGDRAEFELFTQDVQDFFGYTPIVEQVSYEDSEFSYSLFVGYRIARYIAVEGAYARLGHLEYQSTGNGHFPMDQGTLNMTSESETTGFSLSLLGILPISYNWEVYARAGLLFATNSFRIRIDARGEIFAQQSAAQEFSKSSEDVFAGLGVSRRFFDIYDFRLEYQRYFDAGLPLTMNAGDLDVAMLGLTVTF